MENARCFRAWSTFWVLALEADAPSEPSKKPHTRVCAITMAPLLASTQGAEFTSLAAHTLSLSRLANHGPAKQPRDRGLIVTIGQLAGHRNAGWCG